MHVIIFYGFAFKAKNKYLNIQEVSGMFKRFQGLIDLISMHRFAEKKMRIEYEYQLRTFTVKTCKTTVFQRMLTSKLRWAAGYCTQYSFWVLVIFLWVGLGAITTRPNLIHQAYFWVQILMSKRSEIHSKFPHFLVWIEKSVRVLQNNGILFGNVTSSYFQFIWSILNKQKYSKTISNNSKSVQNITIHYYLLFFLP